MPALHEGRARLFTGDDMPVDEKTTTFGFREIRSSGGQWTLNGVPLFLRGTLECCIFPLTGYPPTDVESWKRIIRICKAHGLNHIRFHSWCPPEVAFLAADQLGFYYQVEASSWANEGAEIGSGRPLDVWMERETERMVEAYGNHPSFLLFAYGNEPSGKNHVKWLRDFVAKWKSKDSRRAYTTGAGWPVAAGSDFHSSPDPRLQRWGERLKSRLNAQPPSTDFNWSEFIRKHPDSPVVSHEIGQWCVYPNLKEIEKYTGYFKARNFEIFRETARRNKILELTPDFLRASGKWQAACYKHDIEAALRTPGFGGYQLLDLHDFPGKGTALVGVLDAFWDEKGYINAEEYARFSGPVVPLAELPKLIWSTDENLTARLLLSHFGPSDFTDFTPRWELRWDGRAFAGGTLAKRDLKRGALHELGSISVPLNAVLKPIQAQLVVGDETLTLCNHCDVFIYPTVKAERSPSVVETRSLEDALRALDEGKVVWWMPEPEAIADDPARPLVAGFSPMFWNTAWTNWQPPHTLGLLINQKHPALAAFPTGEHTNWQWWSVQRNARPFILRDLPSHPVIVRPIDDWVTNRPLAYLFEAKVGPGRLLACAFDLREEAAADPASRHMRASILRYLEGDGFKPNAELDAAGLRGLVKSSDRP
ncbi:MAG: beta-galactosidase [Verrucomicrobiales bacterium]